jgi:thiol-disulfide isomerase/thioredoxin
MRGYVRFKDFVFGSAFLMILAMMCAGVFWSVLNSREIAGNPTHKFAAVKGAPFPPFDVVETNGAHVKNADLKNAALVEIFASWCEICKGEIPVLNRLHAAHPDLKLIGISGSALGQDNKPESLSDLAKYRKAEKISFDIAFDQEHTLPKKLNMFGYPSFFLVASDGKIKYLNAGHVSFEELNVAVENPDNAKSFY